MAINRFPPEPGQVDLLEHRAMLAGLPVERMPEAGLGRLFHRPPHAAGGRGCVATPPISL